MTTCVCPTHCPPDAVEATRQRLAAERTRGLIDIACTGEFRPLSPQSEPDGRIAKSLGKEVACEFALAFNESAYADRKCKWACVTTRGALLFLKVESDHRPPSPWMFHPAARELPDCDHETAQELAAAENDPRFEQSQVPRTWTIPLVSLHATWLKREEWRKANELQTA